jgi:hypothetical protein
MDFLESKIKEQLIEIEYRTLSTTPPWIGLAVQSPWKESLLWLMAGARVNRSQRDSPMTMIYQGTRDLFVIEHVLRRWNKDFSIELGSRRGKKEFQLQGEILKHAIHCLDWFVGMGMSKEQACEMFVGIFSEEALTPWAGDSKPTKAESKKRFQAENKQLMTFENPFVKETNSYSHEFVKHCCEQGEISVDFSKNHWYPLVRSRMKWTTFYIEKGIIVKIDDENSRTSLENRSKNKK